MNSDHNRQLGQFVLVYWVYRPAVLSAEHHISWATCSIVLCCISCACHNASHLMGYLFNCVGLYQLCVSQCITSHGLLVELCCVVLYQLCVSQCATSHGLLVQLCWFVSAVCVTMRHISWAACSIVLCCISCVCHNAPMFLSYCMAQFCEKPCYSAALVKH